MMVKIIGNEKFELNTGSPHFVAFIEESVSEIPLISLAKTIRYNETYAQQGINVNFVNMQGLHNLCMRTYERGVEDETYSCGTGATAAALSAAIFANLPAGKHTTHIAVPGGDLAIQFTLNTNKSAFSDNISQSNFLTGIQSFSLYFILKRVLYLFTFSCLLDLPSKQMA